MAREFKDSGIEWIGLIPKEWNTISFTNSIVRMSTGLNPRDNFELTKDDEFFYVTIKNFKDGKIYLDENCDRISKEAWEIIQERSQLQKGDILFASISKDGQAYILEDAPSNWNINESVFCIRVNPEFFYVRYFYYHITDSEFYNDLRLDATGTTFQSIKQNKLRKSLLCLPNKAEQQKIADYLDKVCGEVDEMVTLQETMIEELKAYKQSVITEAVTKGLNPNAPMKDSGIEWIGEIPEHWEVIKLSFLTSKIGSGSTPTGGANVYVHEGVKFLRSQNVYFEGLNLNDVAFITETIDEEMKGTRVKSGDVLLNITGGSIGRCYYVDESLGRANVNQHVSIIRPTKIETIYLKYYLQSDLGQNQIALLQTGGNREGLSAAALSNFKILFPPISEQHSIASYLDTKCTEIDSLIALKQAKIEELKEYKKSVIYEYVTGKKEVV